VQQTFGTAAVQIEVVQSKLSQVLLGEH